MRFSGNARLDGIASVVAAVKKIPVIGNGDVKTPQDAQRMFDATKCAGIMIGRGALVKPWLLRDCWSYVTTGIIPPEPTIDEKIAMIRQHFYNLCRFRNERVAILEFRKRISWYSKTMNPCRMMKNPMRLMNSVEEFESILNAFTDWRHDYDAQLRAGRIAPIVEEEPAEAA
jgi:tRNA-dihydrouridine synthase